MTPQRIPWSWLRAASGCVVVLASALSAYWLGKRHGARQMMPVIRELAEETGLAVTPAACRATPPRYVPDPRSSDEAWAVTTPVHIDLGACDMLPDVTGEDDARRAVWIPALSFFGVSRRLACQYGGQVFAAHVAMLRDFLGEVA